jgi:hypothetical protein
MKGKIAVIDICDRCPYKAFDSTMGIVFDKNEIEEHNSAVAYCGYHKIGFDGSQIRIEPYLDIQSENSGQPKNCPLPNGNDGRNLRKGMWFKDKYYSIQKWITSAKCELFGHKQGDIDFGDGYNCERCYHLYSKETRKKTIFEFIITLITTKNK